MQQVWESLESELMLVNGDTTNTVHLNSSAEIANSSGGAAAQSSEQTTASSASTPQPATIPFGGFGPRSHTFVPSNRDPISLFSPPVSAGENEPEPAVSDGGQRPDSAFESDKQNPTANVEPKANPTTTAEPKANPTTPVEPKANPTTPVEPKAEQPKATPEWPASPSSSSSPPVGSVASSGDHNKADKLFIEFVKKKEVRIGRGKDDGTAVKAAAPATPAKAVPEEKPIPVAVEPPAARENENSSVEEPAVTPSVPAEEGIPTEAHSAYATTPAPSYGFSFSISRWLASSRSPSAPTTTPASVLEPSSAVPSDATPAEGTWKPEDSPPSPSDSDSDITSPPVPKQSAPASSAPPESALTRDSSQASPATQSQFATYSTPNPNPNPNPRPASVQSTLSAQQPTPAVTEPATEALSEPDAAPSSEGERPVMDTSDPAYARVGRGDPHVHAIEYLELADIEATPSAELLAVVVAEGGDADADADADAPAARFAELLAFTSRSQLLVFVHISPLRSLLLRPLQTLAATLAQLYREVRDLHFIVQSSKLLECKFTLFSITCHSY